MFLLFLLQVLVQECIRYNKLIDVMEQSLPELQKALKGLVVMSGELEAVGKAIALNAVPESWEAKVRQHPTDTEQHLNLEDYENKCSTPRR